MTQNVAVCTSPLTQLDALKTESSAYRELDTLIKAIYPLIYIQTFEEERAKNALRDITKTKGMTMYEWTIANGLRSVGGQTEDSKKKEYSQMNDPSAILMFIAQHKESSLFLLKDFHAFMKDAEVIRSMRDIVNDTVVNTDVYKPIVISSPVLTIPTEIEKLTHVVQFALPGPVEIKAVLNDALQMCALDITEDHQNNVVKACQGLTVEEIYNILSKSFVEKGAFDISIILEDKKQVIQKSGVLEYYENLEEFANVGGLELAKSYIQKRTSSFTEEAKAYGIPEPKGVLILGVQGCGKSLLCKAISGLWEIPLIKMDVGRIMSGLVGSSEENMRKALKTAEAISPCVLWLDEIEKALSGSGSSNFSDGGTTARVMSTMLTWLNEKTAPVFVVATANSVLQLPPELLRKGRFDEIFYVGLPYEEERKEIFNIHLTKKKRDPANFDVAALAASTDQFSGAEIEQAIIDAMHDSFHDNVEVDTDHILKAIGKAVPLAITMREAIAQTRQWCSERARFASPYEEAAHANKTKEPDLNAPRKKSFKLTS
jgi:SpoVK/Ycf46/Vps4 family AAA+-type ATPase